MTLLPVIERELRAESRGAFTYWLRVAGAAALLTIAAVAFVRQGPGFMEGAVLFRALHAALFVSIWIVGTLMTADTISRERREGTLGLLFLTPLRPFAVVLAKGLAHGLRAAAVALASVPVLVVPFLMGGIGWREALASVLINFSALCLALTAGLFASALCKTATRALVTAAILECCAFIGLVLMNGMALCLSVAAKGGTLGRRGRGGDDYLLYGWHAVWAPDQIFSWSTRGGWLPGRAVSTWLLALVVIAAVTLLLSLLAALITAENVRRASREKERSVVLTQVEKQFCTPTVAVGFYRRWMRRILERNPIGWLERRTWQARLVTWAWLAVMLSILSWLVSVGFWNSRDATGPLAVLGWVLAANIGLTASGSLRRERESGVIELMLVSPLSVRQIVRGRLLGIAGQFLPAAALLFGTWFWLLHALSALRPYDDPLGEQFVLIGWIIATMLTVPAVGLYFSLRCRLFIVALFWTALVGFVLPWLVAASMSWFLRPQLLEIILGIELPPAVIWLFPILALAAWKTGWKRTGFALALPAAIGTGNYLASQLAEDGDRTLAAAVISATLQTGIALFLAGRLRRRLERRDFALPQ